MQKNVGGMDRILRLVVGGVLVVITLVGILGGVLKWILLIVGAILLVTGAVQVCPLNALFGLNTCKVKEAK